MENDQKSAFEVLSVETNRPARRRSRWAVLSVLLLALAATATAAGCWYVLAQLRAELEQVRGKVSMLAAELGRGPDARLTEALRGLEQGEARMTGLDARVDALGETTATMERQLARIAATDRRDWQLAEAEYLERMAGQSLQMGREVRGALALLGSADAVLRDLDDPSLHAAREALANDIAALRAVAGLDVEGLYLRLSALAGQVPALALQERSRPQALGGEDTDTAAAGAPDWWSRVTAVLGRYVVVRHRDESVKPLLPLAQESYLRIDLTLGIEQAKLALLAAEPVVYRDALGQVRALAAEHLAAGATANRAFIAETEALLAVDIAPPLPDISASLRALRERMNGTGAVAVPASTLPAMQPATPDEP